MTPAAGLGHLFSVDDLGRGGVLALLDRAARLAATPARRGRCAAGRLLGLLFFQPSTRTRFGFHAAMARLRGTAIELGASKHQPGMSEPESLTDTVRCVSAYCDALVLRHPSTEEVQAALAASSVPVVNGGSGVEHHPTQTVIDLFAIRNRLGRLDGLKIGVVGALLGSRAARSLVRALVYFPPSELRLMAPPGHQLPDHLLAAFIPRAVHTGDQLALDGLEVVYMAGLPASEGGSCLQAEVRARFRLTAEAASALQPRAVILDPLPRIDEIHPQVDALPQAGYFEQSRLGLFVRMAVLESALLNENRSGVWSRPRSAPEPVPE
ncbi:MAG TPA: aspartate carbamoyltransferase [Thermoanaerobaculia bacterium]|nr:aspartate carbamoyltransferase [Thermoanaerobaculia bacterium]